ncbi:Uncharacterized protein HZ326_15311 [Fusarium oxysporum f. sp. albedinis]|nr:Uncharacterized protein HZ326_15311 [Fusarium oxysporum f. sp. albedinis]
MISSKSINHLREHAQKDNSSDMPAFEDGTLDHRDNLEQPTHNKDQQSLRMLTALMQRWHVKSRIDPVNVIE